MEFRENGDSRQISSKPEKPGSAPNADKSKLLAQMRHDIRTPMHVVKGMASVLSTSEPLTSQQKKIVSALKSNTDRLFVLIDNAFDFAQKIIDEQDPKSARSVSSSRQSPMQENDKIEKEPCNLTSAKKEAQNKKQSVLLVEDYAPNVLVATSFLNELGYDCDVAETGLEALKKFSASHYDAVIMDIQLPDMDGLETARRMRSLEKREHMAPTPIIATTGNATEDDRFFCLKAGMNDYLSKPFELRELENKLHAFAP